MFFFQMFRRRNEIAHENDRSHETSVQTDIRRDFVEVYINNIECIVNAVDERIEEKDLNI